MLAIKQSLHFDENQAMEYQSATPCTYSSIGYQGWNPFTASSCRIIELCRWLALITIQM